LGIPYRRNGQGEAKQPAGLGTPYGFEMLHSFAAANACENLIFFAPSFRWNEQSDMFTNCFFRTVTQYSLGCGIPGHNYAVESFADDYVVRGLHNRGQTGCGIHRCDRISQRTSPKDTIILNSLSRGTPVCSPRGCGTCVGVERLNLKTRAAYLDWAAEKDVLFTKPVLDPSDPPAAPGQQDSPS
jgi:hypothetical protein